MRVPEVHWNARLDQIPDLPHKRAVIQYVENLGSNLRKGQGLFLHGPLGRGKSALGSIVLKAATTIDRIGLWVRAKSLPTLIIQNIEFDDETTMYERAMQVPILVLDELQLRNETSYTETAAEDLIRYRIDHKLSTIVTTNITLAEMESKWPSLFSVMHEALYPVKVDGHDFRKPMKGKPNE